MAFRQSSARLLFQRAVERAALRVEVEYYAVVNYDRREGGHAIVLNERYLKRILQRYFDYYHRWRTHLSLEMDTPQGRGVKMPDKGDIIEIADLGGLHHHYLRQAA